MNAEQWETYRLRIIERWSPEEVLDLLSLDTEQLVDLLEDYVIGNIEKFDVED